MIAVVLKNKFKSIKHFKAAVKADFFIAKAVKAFTGCRGGILLTKPDGSFIEIALWDKREDFDKVFNNFIVNHFIKGYKIFLEEPVEYEYFKVAIKAVVEELEDSRSEDFLEENSDLDKREFSLLSDGTILGERYKVIEFLRKYKRKAFYKIIDTRLNNELMLKEILIPSGTSSEKENYSEFFKKKAGILVSLSHPGLPGITDYFVNHDRYYIVMSPVEGECLESVLKREGMAEKKIIKWTEDLLQIINYLKSNSMGISYESIGADSVIIKKSGRAVLTNFGLTDELYGRRTTRRISLGDGTYMTLKNYDEETTPPEPCEKQKKDSRFSFVKNLSEYLPFVQKIKRAQEKFHYIMEDILPMNSLMPGMVLENRYEIIKLIKTGGMGAVYKAIDKKLNHICAVKELISSYKSSKEEMESIKWFKREAGLLAALLNPALPRVFDYFVSGNKYYLVMDFIDGENLETILQKEGNPGLMPEKVISWSEKILDVLEYLHSQKPPVVYRDIKPANIMVDKEGRVFLVDFGIARIIKDDSKTLKTNIGTGGYAPLEQYQGKACPQSDLYALGATMHHLLSGHVPVPFDFKPLRTIIPELPSHIEDVVMKALEDDLKVRFSCACQMRVALRFAEKSLVRAENEKNLNSRMDLLFSEGKYEEAIECYDEIMSNTPGHIRDWIARGEELKRQGKYEEAIEFFDRVIEENPGYVMAWIAKGRALKKMKEYERSLKCFDKVIELRPEYGWAWSRRGILFEEVGKYEEAIQCFDRALAIDELYTYAQDRKEKVLKLMALKSNILGEVPAGKK